MPIKSLTQISHAKLWPQRVRSDLVNEPLHFHQVFVIYHGFASIFTLEDSHDVEIGVAESFFVPTDRGDVDSWGKVCDVILANGLESSS